jgi:predicted  nucleic acid-binding Zn-ribbon protein
MKEISETLNTLLQLYNLDKSSDRENKLEKAEALRSRLPQPVLMHYDRCRVRGRKPIAVISADGVCRGCNVRVSCGLILDVQRGDDIQVCENCGCYLIWDADSVAASLSHPR